MKDNVFKSIMKSHVSKDYPCSDYIGKPVTNGRGEIVGTITAAVERDTYIEITMELEIQLPLAKPCNMSFSLSDEDE